MAKVLMKVSGFYDGESSQPGDVVVCDPDYAKRVVLFGHGELLENGAPVSFEVACERLRVTSDDLAMSAQIRAQALADRGEG